jgi:hypothetical protein
MLKYRVSRTCFAALAATLFLTRMANAEVDSFGLGTGRDGPLVVTNAAGVVVNTYAPVTASVSVGATTVTVGARRGAGTTFTKGQVILLWQARGGFAAPLVSGSPTPVALSATTKTGRYELARIASVAGDTLTLTRALVNAFDSGSTQVVSVPEYAKVTVNANAKLTALAWDGATATGGILAFFANDTVTNAGTIDVSGMGFAGGERATAPTPVGCAAEEGTPLGGGAAAGGAHKGEGFDATGFSTTTTYAGGAAHAFGRGNLGHAGGGGNCFNAGGGGGGHAGAGGGGGDTNGDVDTRRAVGGRGGAIVSYDPKVSLVLGGGGGAGDDDDNVGGRGGAAGGVVWMRAEALAGGGTVVADGREGADATGAVTPIYADGAGGGGAGGGVYVWLHGNATCGGITARGGRGGNATPATPGRSYGPGGGGGGGRVFVAKAGGTCTGLATSGAAGTTGGGAFGATSGSAGAADTGAALTSATCAIATGQCGGCVDDTFCPAATPVCVTTAGAAKGTCVTTIPGSDAGTDASKSDGGVTDAATTAANGEMPSAGPACKSTASPPQGTSPGCTTGVCDTQDGRCGYLAGTACSKGTECRSNQCGANGRCEAGTTLDGSVDDGGMSGTDPGLSLEGGGLSCSTTGNGGSGAFGIGILAAVMGLVVRAGRRRQKR